MRSSGTDKPVSAEPAADQPTIEAVCLIAEYPSLIAQVTGGQAGVYKALMEAAHAFGRRFSRPYVVTIDYGLVPLGASFTPSEHNYTELPQERKHLYLAAVRKQLLAIMADGVPCLSLVGGTLAQALRTLEIPMTLPCASMTQTKRRQWLEAAAKRSRDALLNTLFGVPLMYGQ